ncbi:MAG TPA: molybdopterin biosynthesis protein [Anaerolineales bacterium]|nr:molybdopterin biosynthesis protein [Anaerolineales bacterium]
MSVYLHDIPLSVAQRRLADALKDVGRWDILGVERIPLNESALGRVLAEPAWAKVSSPHYHASAMDGYAVVAESTNGAQPAKPITLRVAGNSGAAYIDTGDPLPEWANAVIPIENVEALDDGGALTDAIRKPTAIRIRAAVAPWTYVRPLGEDIVATQLVLPRGHILRPVDLGVLAAAGHSELNVARKPRVAVLPTGSELVPIGSELKRGDILEYNSLVIAAQVLEMGGEATQFPITKDDLGLITERVREAARDYDLVLLNAGSSAGAEDFSARVVEALGTLLVHGVAVRPGHPVILGMLGGEGTQRRVPIIGVPGYPVSAALTIQIFVEPLIAQWLGRAPLDLPVERARLTRKITSPAGDEDYVRVVLGRVGADLLAAPLARGAGVITSLVQADGLVVLPPGIQGVEAGETVDVRLFRGRGELERTILCIGSHDLTLDILAQHLAARQRRFVAANVGSQGGLIALRRREAHLGGSHLLDPSTGDFNIPYIRQYMPGIPVKVVALVGREQGLLLPQGNPKGIHSLDDLARPDVRFVNRQHGAGTRVLLDYHLKLAGISPGSIQGYNQEEYTHLAVAAAVASGRADCGLAVAAAAQALHLDFIPLFRERYDLVMPKEHAKSDLLAPVFDVLVERGFREDISKLPGYDTSIMGSIILEDP